MKNLDFGDLPPALQDRGLHHLQRLSERVSFDIQQTLSSQQYQTLQIVCSLSDFVAETLIKHPNWIEDCLSPPGEVADKYQINEQLKEVTDEACLHQTLRLYRHKRMVQIAITDLLSQQPIESSLKTVSQLADALIMQCYKWLYKQLCSKYATPQALVDGEIRQMNMLIIGMGKLGGNELNFSSDIDLIFVYPEKGEIRYRNKTMEHQQFFTKLAQKLISALHQTTVDGQVFRVDMRLRPFGDSGPLVASLAAIEDYYQSQGREWERYAMVKGRVLNEQDPWCHELQQILQPFVYRRYIDFGAMESLRKMKQLIRQEVRRRQLHNNIKLGSGGIREIEFILQSMQLTRGGKDKELQEKNVLKLIELINDKTSTGKHIPISTDLNRLKVQYLFLRKVEHCLQQFSDEQTQELPDKELDQQRLTVVMGYSDYPTFVKDLKRRLAIVSKEFENVIGETARDSHETCAELQDFWLLPLEPEEAFSLVEEFFKRSDSQEQYERDIAQLLWDYKTELSTRPIGTRGKESLDSLMPGLMQDCLEAAHSKNEVQKNNAPHNKTINLLHRVMAVIKAVLRRTAYLELLLENKAARANLIRLCAMSDWVAQQIAKFPLLLDELLNPEGLTNPTPVAQYSDLLRQQLLRIPEEDLEQQMEALRQFKLSHQLRIAAADLFGSLPVMKVSDHLTYLAETIIQEVVTSAWHQMIEKYGYPDCAKDDDNRFLVVAYGKLGGIELGYSSDLDLVFLHDCHSAGDTSGPKHIDSRQFYAKLAQRIMHLFNTKTSSGELYDVDLRLRPSGNSGLLVSSIDAFYEYQRDSAWTWEHQALVRSRAVCGNKRLRQKFEKIRADILCKQRETAVLKAEVVEMRKKMRQHLDRSTGGQVDAKQGPGAITDIEFITQFWTLSLAHAYPDVTRWSDNVRLIDTMVAGGLIASSWGENLKDAYLKIRNLSHQKALQGTPNLMLQNELEKERKQVQAIWNEVL